eukprot:scpid57692/ scgid8708/ 
MAYEVTCSLYSMIVAPLLCQVIGMLWYGPLFGSQWMVEAKVAPPKSPPVLPFALTIVSNFITAFLMINIHHILGVATLQQAFLVAWVYWVATVSLRIPHYAFSAKSLRLFLIDSVFDVVISIAVSAVVFKLHALKL